MDLGYSELIRAAAAGFRKVAGDRCNKWNFACFERQGALGDSDSLTTASTLNASGGCPDQDLWSIYIQFAAHFSGCCVVLHKSLKSIARRAVTDEARPGR